MRRQQLTNQNNTYLPTITTTGLNLRISNGTQSALRYELTTETSQRTGSILASSQQNYIVKRNRVNAINQLNNVLDTLRIDTRLTGTSHQIRFYNAVIAPRNATIRDVKHGQHNYKEFTTSDGHNAIKNLNELRSKVAKMIANHYRNQSITIGSRKVAPYGVDANTESVITGNAANVTNHYHIHMLIMLIDNDDADQLTINAGNLLKAAQSNIYFNLSEVTTDYKDADQPGIKPAIINTNRPINAQKRALEAVKSVAIYNNKEAGLPAYNHQIRTITGEQSRLTQGQLLGMLPAEKRELAIVAAANTIYRHPLTQMYGILKRGSKLARESFERISLVFILKRKQNSLKTKNKGAEITRLKANDGFASTFKIIRTKPPP